MPAILIGVLLLALAAGAAFLAVPHDRALPAMSDGLEAHRVWVNGTFALHLTAQPCAFSEFRDDLEERGVPPAMPGCYALDLDGDVLIRDVAGTDGFIPIGWFKRQPRG